MVKRPCLREFYTTSDPACIGPLQPVTAQWVDDPPDPRRNAVWAAYVAAKRDTDAALRESGLAGTTRGGHQWNLVSRDVPLADSLCTASRLPRKAWSGLVDELPQLRCECGRVVVR